MPSSPRRRALSLRATLLCAAGALTFAPAASAQTPPAAPAPTAPVIAAGVKVGDIDLSGQTREAATATLTGALAGKRPNDSDVVVRIAGRRHKLAMAKIDYRLDVEKLVIRATKAPANTAVPLAISWDEKQLGSWLDSIAKMQKTARNATVKLGISKQRISGSREGWKIDRGSLQKLVTGALDAPTKPRSNLSQPVVRVKPSVTINGLRSQYGTFITVDRPSFRLRLFKRLKLSKTYKIAVGSEGHSTPAGMYSITSKQVNPAWHVPNSAWAGSLQGQVIPGGAPNNPLKARWLGLRDGIGIHGTSEAWSIGTRASHGCLRMHPADVIDLYDRVPMGTAVRIR